jgi:hypothetical protein
MSINKKTRPGLNAALHHIEAVQPGAQSLGFGTFGANIGMSPQQRAPVASADDASAIAGTDSGLPPPMSRKERVKAEKAAAAAKLAEQQALLEERARARKARAAERAAKAASRSCAHVQCVSVLLSRLQAALGLGTKAAWQMLNATSTTLAKKCVSTSSSMPAVPSLFLSHREICNTPLVADRPIVPCAFLAGNSEW